MNESEKFLRYSVPGIVVLLQLFAALWATDIIGFQELGNLTKNSQGLAVILATFVATGGIGYLLAILVHPMITENFTKLWVSSLKNSIEVRNGRNEVVTLIKLSKKKAILQFFSERCRFLKNFKGEEGNPNSLSKKRDYYWLTVQYWYSRLETSKLIKGVDLKTNSKSDLKHSVGATTLGSVFGFAGFWIYLLFFRDCADPPICSYVVLVTTAVWGGVICLLGRRLKWAKEGIKTVIESTIIQDINNRIEHEEEPENLVVFRFSR